MADAILTAANSICRKCGGLKENGKCKPCAKAYNAAWHAANKDKVAARIKVQRSANPEKYRAMVASWREKNPERIKEYSLQYYTYNRERILSRLKYKRLADPKKFAEKYAKWSAGNAETKRALYAAWAAKNEELLSSRRAEWRANNPEKVRIHKANRRARKKESGGRLSADIAEKLYRLQKGKCACCGMSLKGGFHLDHVVPLALGGANEDWNMQLLTPECNMKKGAKPPEEFMRQRGFLL